jgi:leucine dehydrogenase
MGARLGGDGCGFLPGFCRRAAHNATIVTGPGRGDGGGALAGVADLECVVLARDPRSGARAIAAIHDTRAGPAFGGIRRRGYAGLDDGLADAVALARAMTWKCALAALPAGGGKIVLFDAPDLDRRAAYEFVGELVEQLGGRLHTGPDVGTTPEDLVHVAKKTRHCATAAHGDLGFSTARGVFAAIAATAAHQQRELRGLRVLVQGVGAVGRPLCRLLAEAGAELMVADVDAGRAQAVALSCDARVVPAADVVTADCDLLAPCALGGVLDVAAARSLRAHAVCGAANNVLADDAAGRVLHARGVPLAPDFVANAGGLIHGVLFELTGAPPPPERLARIGATVAELLAASRAEDVPPGELALRRARAIVAAAGLRPSS